MSFKCVDDTMTFEGKAQVIFLFLVFLVYKWMLGEKASSVFLLKSSQCLVGKQKKVGQSDRLSKWPVHTYLYHDNHDSCLSSKWVQTYSCSRKHFLDQLTVQLVSLNMLVLSHLVPRIYFRDQMTLHICKYGQ